MRHPLLHDPARLRRYLLGWLPLLALLMGTLRGPSPSSEFGVLAASASPALLGLIESAVIFDLLTRFLMALPFALTMPFLGLGYWFVAETNPASETPFPRLLLTHTAAAVVGTFGWYALGSFGVSVLTSIGALPDDALRPENRLVLATVGMSSYAVVVLLYYVLIGLARGQQDQLRKEELATLAKDAELAALRFQINPHFLFNALHSVSALTSTAPDRAREMCVRLADFLRRTLRLADRPVVALAEELQLVDDYLELERLRFGERLVVHRDVPDDCGRAGVPPLLLQPLVENAVKHGLGSLLGPMQLDLRARHHGPMLELAVANTFDPEAAPAARGVGVGLTNTRARLARYGGGEGELTVATEDNHYRVTLTLPWTEAPA